MTKLAENRTFIERQVHEQRVLKVLGAGDAYSRKQLSELAGISYPTITKIVNAFVESRILEEMDDEYSGVGRPGKVYRLPRDSRSVAGLVIGPVKCDLVAGGFDGQIIYNVARRFNTPKQRTTLLKTIHKHIDEVSKEFGHDLSGIGVSVPGLLDRNEGRIIKSPNIKLLNGCLLSAELSEQLAMPVAVVQSMHALFLAERIYGRARDVENFVLLNYYGGLGICVCLDGRVMQGANGLAGEFGHTTVESNGPVCECGNRGCLETFATDKVVAEMVSRRIGQELDIEEMLAMIEAGELDATDELNRATDYLAIGVASAINTFNPEVILLCGRFLGAVDGLIERLHERVSERALKASFDAGRVETDTGPPQPMEQNGAIAAIVHELTMGARERNVEAVIGA